MSSKDIYKKRIHPNLPTTKDSQPETEDTVKSPEPHLDESSKRNVVPRDKISSDILKVGESSTKDMLDMATRGLIQVAEDMSEAELSEESKGILANFVNSSSKGYVSTMAMTCKGGSCPFISACPLHEAGSALPIGSRCPVEQTIAIGS
jgi:hypothetical protein